MKSVLKCVSESIYLGFVITNRIQHKFNSGFQLMKFNKGHPRGVRGESSLVIEWFTLSYKSVLSLYASDFIMSRRAT